ncbi:MAG: hemolysin family protein [Patiriisocius sp.]
MEHQIIIIISALICSAFFSGMELAYVSSNKIYIEIEKKQQNFLAGILKKITKRPSKFIATMLIGNNIALVVYGFFMGDILMQFVPIQGPSVLLVHTLLSTLLILLTAEFLPKVFFQIYANDLVKFFAVPAYFFYLVFSFVSEFILWISDLVLKYIFKTDGDKVRLSFSKIELGNYISEQMQSIETEDEVDSEIQIFQNALDFSDIKSREVMIPRTEITAVDITTSVEQLSLLFTETGRSKIIIYKNNIDDVVGYVHSFELFNKPLSIEDILIPVVFVPETILAKDVLNILSKKHKSIAVVVDEYGGTSGVITVEDIIEELFGEIEDEHDNTALVEEIIKENHYRFSARLEVDYLNENYKLSLPEQEHYETLGGMIVNFIEGIPEAGDIVVVDKYQIKIIEVSKTKIDLVSIEISDPNI